MKNKYLLKRLEEKLDIKQDEYLDLIQKQKETKCYDVQKLRKLDTEITKIIYKIKYLKDKNSS